MRASIYNIFTKSDSGELLIYNTLENKFLKIQKNRADIVWAFLNAEKESLTFEEEKKLRRCGIIVEDNIDEKSIAESRFMEMVYGRDTLDITIIPTEDCNFRCVYCYETYEKRYMDIETECAILKWLKRDLKRYKHLVLNWFGGEPLLAKDQILRMMKKIRSIAQEYGVTYRVSMTTNGFFLDAKTFGELIESGIKFYQITLDGPAVLHNGQRPLANGDPSFEKIINNLREIRDLYGKKRFEIKVRINISKNAEDYQKEYLDLLEREFKGHYQFKTDFEWVRNWRENGKKEENISTAPEICLSWIKLAIERKISCSHFLNGSCGMFFCEACKKNGYIINCDATVYKCTLAIYDKNYNKINKIGDINSKGVLLINENNEAKWLGKVVNKEKCNSCSLYPLCMSVNCPWVTQIQKKENCMPIKNLISTYLKALDWNGQFEEV